MAAHLQDGKVGAHAAVAAAAEADEGEGRGLVLLAGGGKALRVEVVRAREHVWQPVAVCWGCGDNVALQPRHTSHVRSRRMPGSGSCEDLVWQ